MFFDLYFYLYLCLIVLGVFLVGFKYFLLLLIVLEVVIMSVAVFMYYVFLSSGLEMIFIYYLVFSVCESVMGLVILVLVVRFYGDDYYKSVSLVKF